MIIAVDFDGTIVEHEYPGIGQAVPGAIETLLELQDKGNALILWTIRVGIPLKEAYDYCTKRGVRFYGVNENPEQKFWNGSPKAYAQIYIDDAAFGCPLVDNNKSIKPYVDWDEVRKLFSLKDLK